MLCINGLSCTCISRVVGWCAPVQKFIKKIVEHKIFQRGILIAILFNTLSMGIEYHNQVGHLDVISQAEIVKRKQMS